MRLNKSQWLSAKAYAMAGALAKPAARRPLQKPGRRLQAAAAVPKSDPEG
jgi:hypothetical protein